MSWWPFHPFQRAREERQKDRDLILAAIKVLADGQRSTADALKAWIDSFAVSEPPVRREFDEDEDQKRFLARRTQQSSPEVLAQYKALVAKLDAFDLD